MSFFISWPRRSGKITLQTRMRTLEEQQRLHDRYLEEKGINYDLPGTERHDTGEI